MATDEQAKTLTVGSKVTFLDYSELQEGMEPLFKKGDELTISQIKDDGSFQAVNAAGQGDTLFPEEFDIPAPAKGTRTRKTAEKAPAAAAPAAAKAETKAAGKAATTKGKGGAVATAAAKAKEKAEAKAASDAAKAKAKEEAKAAKDAAKAETKAAKVAPPAKTRQVVEPEKIEIKNTEALEALLEGQDALAAAEFLVAQAEETYFNLGGVLAHIYYGGLYKQAGFDGPDGFGDYTKEKLNIDYRKALYLAKIYTKFTEIGVDEKRLTEIGWSKAKELTQVVTNDNFDELVDYAKEHTRDELIAHIKTSYVSADGSTGGRAGAANTVAKKTYKFQVFADQSDVIDRSIKRAQELNGSEDMNAALSHIITEWATLTEGVEVSLEESLKVLEAKHGVTLTTVEPEAEAA